MQNSGMEQHTPHQQLLIHLRDERCAGNAAELARKIGKDGTYVNRLFYPIGKKGGKGIGLEIMQACTTAFSLPPGFWEATDTLPPSYKVSRDDASLGPALLNESSVIPMPAARLDKYTAEAVQILSKLTEVQRAECVGYLRGYLEGAGPPIYGQALPMAVKKEGAA